MAKSAMTWEGRRALTDNPNTTPAAFKQAARELMEKNLLADAATFFALAADKGDEEAKNMLGEIAAGAAEEGDFFLFQAALASLGPDFPVSEHAETLFTAAEKNGKAMYAERVAQFIEKL